MGETRAEVSAVDVKLLLTGDVDVLAARTVNFDARGGKFFAYADGEHVLALAQHSGAVAKGAKHELLLHHSKAARGEDEASVYKAVEVHGALVNFEEILVI